MQEKSKKIKSSITRILVAVLLISSWAVLGVVLALSSAKIQMGGMISFKASEISANVSGSITGTKTEYTLEDITITPETTQSQLATMQDTWSGWTLNFDKSKNNMQITVNIENSGEESIWAIIEDGIGSDDNLTITRTYTQFSEDETTTENFDGTYEIFDGEDLELSINLKMNSTTKKIEDLVFVLDISLTSIEPPKDASEYPTLSFSYDEDSKTASISKNSSNEPTGDLIIPEQVSYNNTVYEVTSIENFWNCIWLTSVFIPSSIGYISSNSFSECTSLKSITIPSSVTSIDDSTFYNCTSLKSIILPSSIKSIGDYAFCKAGLNSITIPSSVTSIGDYAFQSCTNLTSVILSEGLTNIGEGAFAGCPLNSITIPSSVISIGESAFSTETLESIIVDTGNTIYSSYENGLYEGTELILGCKNTIIKNDTTSIGGYAFVDCLSLTSITIPSSVITIDTWGFNRCTNLTSVTFENTTGWKAESTTLSSTDLVNTSTAATYLVETYSCQTWTRSDL